MTKATDRSDEAWNHIQMDTGLPVYIDDDNPSLVFVFDIDVAAEGVPLWRVRLAAAEVDYTFIGERGEGENTQYVFAPIGGGDF